MDDVETVSRAYEPEAWKIIDLYFESVDLPPNYNSFWPDLSHDMKELAEKKSQALIERMRIALDSISAH